MRLFIHICFLLLFIPACTLNSPQNEAPETKVIAKAGSETLDENKFREIFISIGKNSDSLLEARKSIDAWATESLFYQEALEKLNEDEVSIDKQVEDYKKSLVNYIYQSKLIEANLDTAVEMSEIEAYYNEHRDNFILKENIIKVNYFKIPVTLATLPKIKRLVWSDSPKNKEQLQEMVIQNAENYFLNDSSWLFIEDIKKEIPALREQPDYILSKGKLLEFSDDQYYYYLKVKDVKIKNALSPLSFERKNIKKFIINNRKAQLIKSYKQGLLEKAINSKSYLIN